VSGRRTLRLGGVHEVAEVLAISKAALADRRQQDAFPAPLAELRCGPIWDLREIRAYKRRYRRPTQWSPTRWEAFFERRRWRQHASERDLE
jgi:hypothetical protein